MRVMLFFDLSTLTSEDLKSYRNFMKNLKKEGFYMLQESVYVKMVLNQQIADSTINAVKSFSPKNGNIMVLVVTEKQFSSIITIIGENKTDVINDIDRIVIL